jgi:hypothetical protein
MKLRWVSCSVLAGVVLAGCGSGNVAPSQGAFNGSGSWIQRSASQGPLIYASSSDGGVAIYNYSGQQVGSLDGIFEPRGLCSDSNGDVLVTSGRDLIYEYQSGGSLPVNILDDRGYQVSSCAVDPTTGNVAVTNSGTNQSENNGNVVIYPPGSSGNPVIYTAPNIGSYAFCGYDASGNLYVDGTGSKQSFQIAALDKGSGSFVAVPLSGLNNKNHLPAGVQWDGQYVAVGDGLSGALYRLTISGSSAKIAQTVTLAGWHRDYAVEFAIVGKKLLFPKDSRLLFYSYPAGGKYKNGFLASVGYDITVTTPP